MGAVGVRHRLLAPLCLCSLLPWVSGAEQPCAVTGGGVRVSRVLVVLQATADARSFLHCYIVFSVSRCC